MIEKWGKKHEQTNHRQYIKIFLQYMKKCSIWLKANTKIQFSPIRPAKVKKHNTIFHFQGFWEIDTPIHCRCKCKLIQIFWKEIWQTLIQLYIYLLFDPSNLQLGTYHKNELPGEKCICKELWLEHCYNCKILGTI